MGPCCAWCASPAEGIDDAEEVSPGYAEQDAWRAQRLSTDGVGVYFDADGDGTTRDAGDACEEKSGGHELERDAPQRARDADYERGR